ncbi:MAG: dephospho-CoA kinase [Oscillospiraceae bacterium]|nr:dephospho-CoA kinase [Oscillospiraceae bacterium]MBR1458157.1 dephospho-CoA kinase [Oscillospiraceae bacterium]
MTEPSGSTVIVGLTGQTGAGKSTVSRVFVEQGFSLIDADRIAREVVEPGSPCLDELFEYFGSTIRGENNSLNRRALASIVFTDAHKLEVLNSIIHPYITEEIFRRINQFAQEGHILILLDAPTLFESKASDFCDLIISVLADPEIRRDRIIARDHLTEEAALQRMQAQLPEEFFVKHSDYIIRNNADLTKLTALAEEVADKVKAYYQQKHQ